MQAGFSGILLNPPFTGNDFTAQIGFASQQGYWLGDSGGDMTQCFSVSSQRLVICIYIFAILLRCCSLGFVEHFSAGTVDFWTPSWLGFRIGNHAASGCRNMYPSIRKVHWVVTTKFILFRAQSPSAAYVCLTFM